MKDSCQTFVSRKRGCTMKACCKTEYEPVFFSGDLCNSLGMNEFVLLTVRRNMQLLDNIPVHWAVKFGSRTWRPVRKIYKPLYTHPETWCERQFGKLVVWLNRIFGHKVKVKAHIHQGFNGWNESYTGIRQAHWKHNMAKTRKQFIEVRLRSAI